MAIERYLATEIAHQSDSLLVDHAVDDEEGQGTGRAVKK